MIVKVVVSKDLSRFETVSSLRSRVAGKADVSVLSMYSELRNAGVRGYEFMDDVQTVEDLQNQLRALESIWADEFSIQVVCNFLQIDLLVLYECSGRTPMQWIHSSLNNHPRRLCIMTLTQRQHYHLVKLEGSAVFLGSDVFIQKLLSSRDLVGAFDQEKINEMLCRMTQKRIKLLKQDRRQYMSSSTAKKRVRSAPADCVYLISGLLDSRRDVTSNDRFCLVEWKDFPLSEATWEPADNLPSDVVQEFLGNMQDEKVEFFLPCNSCLKWQCWKRNFHHKMCHMCQKTVAPENSKRNKACKQNRR